MYYSYSPTHYQKLKKIILSVDAHSFSAEFVPKIASTHIISFKLSDRLYEDGFCVFVAVGQVSEQLGTGRAGHYTEHSAQG